MSELSWGSLRVHLCIPDDASPLEGLVNKRLFYLSLMITIKQTNKERNKETMHNLHEDFHLNRAGTAGFITFYPTLVHINESV